MATEAKTTALDTFHTRTVFQRSATREERHCFLSLALPHSVWTANSVCGKPVCGKPGWLEHKPRDHGFDPSVSLTGFCPIPGQGQLLCNCITLITRGCLPQMEEEHNLLQVGLIQFNIYRNYLVPTMYWTLYW